MKEEDFYWDWLKHENRIFTNRGSFFLVAESVLLAVVFSIVFPKFPGAVMRLVYAGGFFITIVWFLVNIKQVYGTFGWIESKLEAFEGHPWVNIKKELRKKWGYSSRLLLGVVLPCIFLLVWGTLLFKTIFNP